jgi:hypothetical protein
VEMNISVLSEVLNRQLSIFLITYSFPIYYLFHFLFHYLFALFYYLFHFLNYREIKITFPYFRLDKLE